MVFKKLCAGIAALYLTANPLYAQSQPLFDIPDDVKKRLEQFARVSLSHVVYADTISLKDTSSFPGYNSMMRIVKTVRDTLDSRVISYQFGNEILFTGTVEEVAQREGPYQNLPLRLFARVDTTDLQSSRQSSIFAEDGEFGNSPDLSVDTTIYETSTPSIFTRTPLPNKEGQDVFDAVLERIARYFAQGE